MSGIRVSNLRGETAGSSPTFPDGVIVTGVATATTFSGNLTGDVTGNVVGNVTGDVTGNISGTTGSFTGNVSIGGTLTYEDVTNVDSVGVITARSGIKIGAGQSVSAVSGIITYYGDGSQLTGVDVGVSNFIATGTIPNGVPVIVRSDGTVGVITQTGSDDSSVGTKQTFESADTQRLAGVYIPDVSAVVVIYRDAGNNNYATWVVGAVDASTESISWGTPYAWYSAAVDNVDRAMAITYDTSVDRVVLFWCNNGDEVRCVVGEVQMPGKTLDLGSTNDIDGYTSSNLSAAYHTAHNRVVVTWRGQSDYVWAMAGTVAGGSTNEATFGSKYDASSSSVGTRTSVVYDANSEKMVVAYQDGGDSDKGKARVLTTNGSEGNRTITGGTIAEFEGGAANWNAAVYDSANYKVVIAYQDTDNSNYGTAVVGTVSGTNITFGTPVVFASEAAYDVRAYYDPDAARTVVGFKDASSNLKSIKGTVSGTSITFDTAITVNSNGGGNHSAFYDTGQDRGVYVFRDTGNSSYGTSVVQKNSSSSTNLTTENYIGLAAAGISSGATGKITTIGGVNTGQTGLTTARTYYVQRDGTLATSADTPSVVAGTSISATQILVR